jgi:tetratricopeptide (TPR) repeat protein
MSTWRQYLWFFGLAAALAGLHAAVPGDAMAAGSGTRIALVIGNANYPDAEAPLRHPITDARTLADELRRSGFDVDVQENLSKQGMQSAIDGFKNKITPRSAALIFFSGYGIQTNRQSYMIPVNAQIWSESDVRRDGISIDSLLSEMNERGASVKIVIIDASRRNPFERRFGRPAVGLAPLNAPQGTLVMYAAGPGKVANDGNNEHTLFAGELLKEIRSPGLTAEEVFKNTRVGVSHASNDEQVPLVSSSLTDDFYFGRPKDMASKPDIQQEVKPQEIKPLEIKPQEAKAPEVKPQEIKPQEAKAPEVKPQEIKPQEARPQEVKPQEVKPQEAKPQEAKSQHRMSAEDEAAITKQNEALRANPNDVDAYYKRGLVYASNGQFNQALSDFDQALRIEPNDPETLNNRCWTRAVIGELQGALADCDKAIALRPTADVFDSRGFIYLKLGLLGRAIADYDAAIKREPKKALSLYGRGKAKLRNGDTAGGNADLAAAKSIQPDIAAEFEEYGVR